MNKLTQVLSNRQVQELAIKPKMLQSLEMLAMPLMELELHLKHELINNPMLEMIEDGEEDDSAESPEENYRDEESEEKQDTKTEQANFDIESDNISKSDPDTVDDPEIKATLDEAKELSEILDSWNEYHLDDKYSVSKDDSDYNMEHFVKARENRKEEFLLQLERLDLSPQEYDFTFELIDSIDSGGYLPEEYNIYDIGDEFGLSAQRVDELHELLLQFDPKGITARSIQECLLSQLEEEDLENEILVEMIKHHFDDLIHRRYQNIASALDISLDRVQICRDYISRLDPKPGLRLIESQIDYIVPDVIIKNVDGEYEIIINDSYTPNIILNRNYRKIINSLQNDKNALEYVRGKINSAKFLIKSIYMRNKTLERVTRCIIDHQKPLFYGNTGILEPLTYSVLAAELNVNESTISRVVRVKYADTPFGIMCLKDFFTSKAGKDRNYVPVSRQNVQVQIKKLIEAEAAENPLSDQDIVDILKERGVSVSRRVIAKYREAMNILNSRLRKKD